MVRTDIGENGTEEEHAALSRVRSSLACYTLALLFLRSTEIKLARLQTPIFVNASGRLTRHIEIFPRVKSDADGRVNGTRFI